MNKNVDELLMELGKAYYKNRFIDPLPEFLPLFDEITAALNAQNDTQPEEPEEPEVQQGWQPEEPEVQQEWQPEVQPMWGQDNGIRFCTACGEKIYPGSFFCTSCGRKVE